MSKSEELTQALLMVARRNHKDTYHKMVYSDEWEKFKEHFNSLESEKAALEKKVREQGMVLDSYGPMEVKLELMNDDLEAAEEKLKVAVEALKFCQQMVKMRPELWESMIYEENKAALAHIENGEKHDGILKKEQEERMNELGEKLKDIKIDMLALNKLNEHDNNAAKEAHERLDYLEELSQTKYSQTYRDGFVQGYVEASWKRTNHD